MKTPRLKVLFLSLCLLLFPAVVVGNDGGSPLRIAILGDSLTAGYGLPRQDGFAFRLQQRLRRHGWCVEVVNEGVSGDTSAGGLARLDWVLAHEPALVIVELGGNDALRGLSPDDTRNNLAAILRRLDEAGVTVLLAGMRAPRNLGERYYSRFDRLYPELAARHDVAFYPFFLEGVAGRQELNLADGIHPNERGVETIVEQVVPVVEPVLRSLPTPRNEDCRPEMRGELSGRR